MDWNPQDWHGHRVCDYSPDSRAFYDRRIYHLGTRQGGIPLTDLLLKFLGGKGVEQTPGLILGVCSHDIIERDYQEALELLIAHRHRLPNLTALWLGYNRDLAEIQQTDVTPLLESSPLLEKLRIHGGNYLGLQPIRHLNLRSLMIVTCGLDGSIVRSLAGSVLPALRSLELHLGVAEQGGNTTTEDLHQLLDVVNFPQLRYLGLRNSEIADKIAQVAADSPSVASLEELDLSLGTLSDPGGWALFRGKSIPHLKRLKLYHHYLSTYVIKQLETLPLAVNLRQRLPRHDDIPYWRPFVAYPGRNLNQLRPVATRV